MNRSSGSGDGEWNLRWQQTRQLFFCRAPNSKNLIRISRPSRPCPCQIHLGAWLDRGSPRRSSQVLGAISMLLAGVGALWRLWLLGKPNGSGNRYSAWRWGPTLGACFSCHGAKACLLGYWGSPPASPSPWQRPEESPPLLTSQSTTLCA